jgi:glycosyltransferase involved in cell wall biosynthesis
LGKQGKEIQANIGKSGMIKLSTAIITLNEEANIERCLKSVRWADEIVIVDSGSTDSTQEICHKYNCKFIPSPWLGFGKTKQLAVDKASNNWILVLDADEELTPELIEEIKALLNSEPPCSGYRIKRNSFYLGKPVRHCGWNNDYTLRLFNRNCGGFNDKTVHEYVELKGQVCQMKNAMLHYTYPDLDTHFTKMRKYAVLGADAMYKKGKKSNPCSAVLRSNLKFLKMYFLQLGFLDGKTGFLLSVNSAWGVYLKYLLLWAKNKSKSSI